MPPKLPTFAHAPLWSGSLRQPTKHCKHQRLALEIVDLGVFGARKNLDPMLLRHWGVWGGIKVLVPEGKELHTVGPENRVAGRRHRWITCRRENGGAGAGRTRQGQRRAGFAAFELLATLDYFAQAKMPTLAFAAAEDVTQRTSS